MQEAAGSVDAVKAIVREQGWITGGRGTLTVELMCSAAGNRTQLLAMQSKKTN